MALKNRVLALIGVVAIVLLVLVAVGRGAKDPKFVDMSDSFATAAYLDAEYRALLSIKANSIATTRAIKGVVTRVTANCPRVVSGVSYGSHRGEGEAWATDVIDLAVVRSEARIDARFREAVIRLHWTDPSVTSLVAADLRKLQSETEVRMPPLCHDLRIWASDDFRRAPMRLSRFLREFDDLSEGEDRVPAALRRFERSSDRAVIRAIKRDKPRVGRAVRHDLWIGRKEILSALGF